MTRKRSRSADTKDRIVQAARRLFSESGYERTTIRAVAAEARIDPSMVMRYFESKEGLFAAASSDAFNLRLPDISAMPRDEIGERLVRHFLVRWEEDRDGGLVVLLRSASTNEEARARMREVFRGQVMPMVASVVADPREALLRAELVGSQIIGLAFCRFVLETPMLGGSPETIVERIGPVLQAHLFGTMSSSHSTK